MADIAITAANFVPSASASFVDGLAGGTLTRGQPVYLDSATNTYKAAKADAAGTSGVVGYACEDVGSGQKVFVVLLDPALALGGTIAQGAAVYLSSANAGGVTSTYADLASGNQVVFVGIGNGSNKINFRPLAAGAKP